MARLARILVAILLPLVLVAAAGYFVLQAWTGQYGRLALERAEMRHAAAQIEVERLERRLAEQRRRNGHLRPDSLDLDLLDERARIELGLIRPDEVLLVNE